MFRDKIYISEFDFPTESLITKNEIFEKFRKKMIHFEPSPVFPLKKRTVILNKMSFTTPLKINLIKAKIKNHRA